MVGIFRLVEPQTWHLYPIQEQILERTSRLAVRDPTFFRDSLCPLITQELGVSLRALDWLVTNYAKRTGLVVNGVAVHQSYKDHLRTYRRRHFDPFQRVVSGNIGKVTFEYAGDTFATTVGQLNFVLWGHSHGLVEYIRDHINDIELDMTAAVRARRANKRRRCTKYYYNAATAPACIRQRH